MYLPNRIALFGPTWLHENFATSPATQTLLSLFLQDGIQVDVFTERQITGLYPPLDQITNIYGAAASPPSAQAPQRVAGHTVQSPLQRKLKRTRIKLNWLKNELRKMPAIYYSQYEPRKCVSSRRLRAAIDDHVARTSYDCAIGIEEGGIILARHSLPQRTPLLYYSLELYTEDHPAFAGLGRYNFRHRKRMQRLSFPHARAVVIQDHDRARVLFEDMRQPYDAERVITFPVSFLGQAQMRRDGFLRERFTEIGERTILLQFGSIRPDRFSDEIIQASHSCPSDMAVVVHGSISHDCWEALQTAPCLASTGDVPFEEVEKVPASADIGLIFYQSSSDNNRLIAHASGQLALFLKCGVPVIVDDKPSLRSLVEAYHCGVAVQKPADIFDAARHIRANYDAYCQGALRCFAQEHDLLPHYAQLREKLASLV